MPASRSRTERWRECLEQILQRGGTVDITPARQGEDTAPDLIWRVRITSIGGDALTLERPVAMGRPVELRAGSPVIVAMSIGQNRWMFHSRVQTVDGGTMRINAPQQVERCQRRSYYRISTATLHLPVVECWPLLDPTTVIPAELANRAQVLDRARDPYNTHHDDPPGSVILPEVGPAFKGELVNIGGGGAALLVGPDHAATIERCRLLWLRIDLRPHLAAPIGLTARLAHAKRDSAQNVTAGVAFDFAFHPGHKEFVVEQICRYVAMTQARLSEAA